MSKRINQEEYDTLRGCVENCMEIAYLIESGQMQTVESVLNFVERRSKGIVEKFRQCGIEGPRAMTREDFEAWEAYCDEPPMPEGQAEGLPVKSSSTNH